MQNRSRDSPCVSEFAAFPLWVITFSLLLGGMAILMVIIALVPEDINGVRHSRLFLIGAVMIVEILLFVLVIQRMVASRIRALSHLLSEDILIVAGDPATFECLEKLPVLGISEINLLQCAIQQLYFGFSADLRRRGVTPLVSHGGGATGGEADIGVWCEEDAEEPSVHDYRLDEYLLSRRYRYRQKLNNVLHIPAGTGSRATSFVRGLFNSASAPIRTTPVDRDFLECGQFAETQRRRGPSSTMGSVHTGKSSLYTAVSFSSLKDQTLAEDDDENEVSSTNEQLIRMTPLTPDESEECDPLHDNINNDFGILSTALKLEGAIIFQIIKSVRVGRSLSSITLPVHILESRSLLEIFTDMFVCWELLLPVATGYVKDPVERLRTVLRWFLAAYHWRPKGGAKKPYNPILGEVFQCKCPAPMELQSSYSSNVDADKLKNSLSEALRCCPSAAQVTGEHSHMRYIAEQVSHRPPVSVFYAELPELIVVHGVYLPRSKLVSLNCAASICCSSVQLRFPYAQCEYTFNLPDAYGTGVIAGTPRFELGGVVRIEDRHSPAYATIDFLRKGVFGGQYDEVVATISHPDGKSRAEEYTGLWHGTISPRVSGLTMCDEPLFDASTYQLRRGSRCGRPHAFPIAGGHPKQSRAVWRELTVAIRHQDAEAAARAKFAVEEAQRAERKQMQTEERAHTPRFFQFVGPGNVAIGNEAALGRYENWPFTAQDVLFTKNDE